MESLFVLSKSKTAIKLISSFEMPLTAVVVWQFGWDGSEGLPVDEGLMRFISGLETWAEFLTFLCLIVHILKVEIKQGLREKQNQTTEEILNSDTCK